MSLSFLSPVETGIKMGWFPLDLNCGPFVSLCYCPSSDFVPILMFALSHLVRFIASTQVAFYVAFETVRVHILNSTKLLIKGLLENSKKLRASHRVVTFAIASASISRLFVGKLVQQEFYSHRQELTQSSRGAIVIV